MSCEALAVMYQTGHVLGIKVGNDSLDNINASPADRATITNLDRIIADLEGALRTCTWQLQEVGKLIDSARGEAGIDSQLIDLKNRRDQLYDQYGIYATLLASQCKARSIAFDHALDDKPAADESSACPEHPSRLALLSSQPSGHPGAVDEYEC